MISVTQQTRAALLSGANWRQPRGSNTSLKGVDAFPSFTSLSATVAKQ